MSICLCVSFASVTAAEEQDEDEERERKAVSEHLLLLLLSLHLCRRRSFIRSFSILSSNQVTDASARVMFEGQTKREKHNRLGLHDGRTNER